MNHPLTRQRPVIGSGYVRPLAGPLSNFTGTPRQLEDLSGWIARDPESSWLWRGVFLVVLGMALGMLLASR